ncbi:RNA polymerase sigma factor [Roseiterribacter gracilis]|uniref:RNA polymerase sigma factor n=1 Tax=Roseiterribacter gracilis TaxID=2812848 RepID=UPI003B43C345
MTDAATANAIQAVWRIESAKLIAGLTRVVRDVGLAEELAQDALVAALERWPTTGIPDKPAAWLMATARNRAIDQMRRRQTADRKYAELGRDLQEQEQEAPDYDTALDDDVGDDLLRLVFIACHPSLPTESQIALTLRMLGGLTTDEIARAFLVQDTTIQQRIVRAKRTLAGINAEFELPRGADRAARIASVLTVLYLIFNEGYSATAGDDLTRPALAQEAMRLGRVLAGLAPDDGDVHGLVALMELQASRMHARTNAAGEPVLLLDQDRSRWDQSLIRHGLAALARAEQLGNGTGTYTLQAGIAACHARAHQAGDTDWARIASLYDALAVQARSPVVELNRAVAHAMAFGPEAGLALADALMGEPSLRAYHLLPSARADFLAKLGRNDEARAEFERAASMTQNMRERTLLLGRAAEL